MSQTQEPRRAARSFDRREWMAVLARTPRESLQAALEGMSVPRFDWLRAPDIGLAMVRARIGGTGDAFNLGETTVTRATLRLHMEDGSAPVGVALHMGRDKERAKLAALLDALLQTPEHGQRLQTDVLAPFAARIAEQRRRKETEAASTKVEFFTMVRGE